MADKNIRMRSLRIILTVIFTVIAGSGDPAHAQTLYRNWHLHMSDIKARSRVSSIKGERTHDAQGGVRVSGILAQRVGSDRSPEEFFFDIDLTTTLLRGTEYDPDFLRSSTAAGYRHRRKDYTIDIYGEHLRRMNTDRLGRVNANFFGAAVADPEFELRRFGTIRRIHGRIAFGGLVNDNGFNGEARYQAAIRYDYEEFPGRPGKFPLPKGQIFLEGQMDAINAPGGFRTDIEGGIRFLFFPEADNSISFAVKLYDSKNPFGHGEDGIRFDLDLEGGHTGELFKRFLGNTSGGFSIGGRGEDIATELAADFDLVRIPFRRRNYLVILDTLQRATWGKLNKIEYNLQSGVETTLDEKIPYVGRLMKDMISGLYFDHRSTHGLDRTLPERNYNLLRLGIKSQGWDPGRENETRHRIAGLFSIGNYVDNTFDKNRDWDARAGIRIDGRARQYGSWEAVPYLTSTVRTETGSDPKREGTVEVGIRFNGNSLFARWSQDAYFGEGGFGGLTIRF